MWYFVMYSIIFSVMNVLCLKTAAGTSSELDVVENTLSEQRLSPRATVKVFKTSETVITQQLELVSSITRPKKHNRLPLKAQCLHF